MTPEILWMLRLLPILKDGISHHDARQKTKNYPPELLEEYEKFKEEYSSKQGKRLLKERVQYIKRQEKRKSELDRETKIILSVYDVGLDPSQLGCVYYSHTDTLGFGAISDLTNEQISEIETKMQETKLPCAYTIKRKGDK